jgi:hypothetical protein
MELRAAWLLRLEFERDDLLHRSALGVQLPHSFNYPLSRSPLRPIFGMASTSSDFTFAKCSVLKGVGYVLLWLTSPFNSVTASSREAGRCWR